MNTSKRRQLIKQIIDRSIDRHKNMKDALRLGITDFRSYQDSLESVVNKEVKLIIKMTERLYE